MGRPGIAAGLFNCLCQQGINLRLIATSEVKVSCGSKPVPAAKLFRRCVKPSTSRSRKSGSIPPTTALGTGRRGVALDRDQVQLVFATCPIGPAPQQRCVQPWRTTASAWMPSFNPNNTATDRGTSPSSCARTTALVPMWPSHPCWRRARCRPGGRRSHCPRRCRRCWDAGNARNRWADVPCSSRRRHQHRPDRHE